MPEYLAPGVYVEETSFRAKSIEGVGTSTTAFAGPTLKGPAGAAAKPELLTSFNDFERLYGGLGDLAFADATPATNYLAHAVLAYFNEGGSRLYVARVLASGAAAAAVEVAAADDGEIRFVARSAGSGGNGRIAVRAEFGPGSATSLANAPAGSLLETTVSDSPVYHLKVGADWLPLADRKSVV